MNRRRGFTLIELLLAISLLGVFMLIASRLIVANFHIAIATLAADSNTARFDRAVAALRSDVTSSNSMEIPEPALLRLNGPGNQIVEWHTDGNSLVRTAAHENRSWEVGQPLRLQLDGVVLLLSVNGSDQIAMASPAKGGTR